MDAVSADPIMPRLKAETYPDHMRLEETVDILNNLATLESYKRLLARHAGFVFPLERVLAGQDWSSIGLEFDERSRAGAMKRDLAAMDIDSFPEIELWTGLDNFARAVGTLYVLEGSTLGGMIIARNLKERLGIDGSNGGEYFSGRGKQTMAMWRTFGESAELYVNRFGGAEDMIAGAKQTFDQLTEWFQA